MRIFRFATSVFLGVVVATTAAYANPPATALQADAIRSQQAQIKAGLDGRRGAYKDMPGTTREQLLSHQARVLELIDGKQSTDDLDDVKKAELFAALDSIDAVVSKANNERVVCELVRKLGSNHKERVCRPAGQAHAGG